MPRQRQLRQVSLRGDYVRLEPLRLSHAEALWPAASEPGLFQHLAPGTEASLENLRAWIMRRLEEEDLDFSQPFVQVDPATQKPFGVTCFLNISVRHKRVEIGHTWMGASHRRTPANTEAKLLMLRHAFDDWEAIRVQFKCDVDNQRAIDALERIGAVREGRMRNERIMIEGTIRDSYVYSIIREEWREVEKRLERFLLVR